MTAGGVAITVEACAKTFSDGTRALQPVSFDIERGETVVILGPSGCGKTTALRIVAGLETPDAGGRVLFDGEDVTRAPIERRNIGMVFQSNALFSNMTVIDNVAYGLKVRGLARVERRAQAGSVLQMMRIGDLGARRVDQLSGGQSQRVALARAIAIKPGALLLDEPLTALDASLREELRAEIDQLLRGLGITTVYVTHDQAEAMALADRIFVMERGRIAQIGAPQDIYFRPANRFVADFVGTMNRLDGVVREGQFRTAAGALPAAGANDGEASLFFRPESATLVSAEGAPLRFKVERVHFLGSVQRVYLKATGDAPPVVVAAGNRAALAPGLEVGLFIPAESLLRL